MAFKIARTWVCLHGCASTASPFRLSLFSLVIISYSPIPFLSLRQCVCHPGCSSFPFCSPILLSVLFSSAWFHPSSPQGCTGTFPCLYPEECRLIPNPPLPLLPCNPFSVLWKMLCWQFWENYLPVLLQRKVSRLQLYRYMAQPDHLSPQNKTPPQQQERHLSVKLCVASPHPVQLYCPFPVLLLCDVLHALLISLLVTWHINRMCSLAHGSH